MIRKVLSIAFIATLASCGNSNAVETQASNNVASGLLSNSQDFVGIYDLVDSNTVYNDCGSSIEIKSECHGLKIYSNNAYNTDDFCNVHYPSPSRNPTFPDRNPPPPDRVPPAPDRNPPPPDRNPPPPDRNPPIRKPRLTYNHSKYSSAYVEFNGNVITSKGRGLTKTLKLENGILYKEKYNNHAAIKCVYQKR